MQLSAAASHSTDNATCTHACTATEFWTQYMRALEDIDKTATMLALAFDGGGAELASNEGLVRKLDTTIVEYDRLVTQNVPHMQAHCGTYCTKQVRADDSYWPIHLLSSSSTTSTPCACTCAQLPRARTHIIRVLPANYGRTPIRRRWPLAVLSVYVGTRHRCTHWCAMQCAK